MKEKRKNEKRPEKANQLFENYMPECLFLNITLTVISIGIKDTNATHK
jgi:hypothetical protein